MCALLLLLLCGPAETIAGKYVPRDDAPEGPGVAALCARIEAGADTPESFAALGRLLLERGEPALAYRAFHKAHRMRSDDPAWGRRMIALKEDAKYVPDPVIEAEEREARAWREALRRFRNAHDGDLEIFYERYGRPEESMAVVMRARRRSWIGGVAGALIGVAFLAGARLVPRRAALLPLAVGALCLAGPSLAGRTGLFYWGAGFALAGAAAAFALGKTR